MIKLQLSSVESTSESMHVSIDRRARILLVDDHQIVRQGIRSMLDDSRRNWEICGEAASGDEAVQKVKTLNPDLIVLDLKMPGINGFETTRLVRELGFKTRIIIFSMHNATGFINEARNVGAEGYVRKSEASRELVVAIDKILSGGTFFPTSEAAVSLSPNYD
jgi:DNA-binding NarL/FixJ family response regulator